MLAKSTAKRAASGSGNGTSAKRSAKAGAKKTSRSGAQKSASTASRKSTSSTSGRKSAAGARKSTSSKAGKSSAPGARKGSSARAAGSASPAMKRTNAAPTKPRTPTKRDTPHPPKAEKTVENTAPKTMREPDAVDLLTDDHLAVAALFQRYERLAKRDAGADERRALAQQICQMLKVHTQLEEELFYPAARAGGIDADTLDEAKVEHATAKDLIAQIEGGNPDDDLYDAKMTVLREYIQHHVVEEHTEVFPKCRRGGIDLVTLRGELETRKLSLEPGEAATAEVEPEVEPGLLSRLSDKLFSSSDDKGESPSGSRG
jgi:Hemerythrin HHE cation binding domain